jgi:TatD DNase family protein
MNYIDIHTHTRAKQKSVFNCFFYEEPGENICCSLGIHPWYIDINNFQSDLKLLKEKSVLPMVLAIGECGIDKLKGPDLAIQKAVFIFQAELAEAISKPLIIHCVHAFSEIISIKQQIKPAQTWIIHGFAGKANILSQLIDQGFYISVGTKLLLHSDKLKLYLKLVPDDKLFFETDEDMVPIENLFSFAAEFKRINIEDLAKKINNNFISVFGKDADKLV